MTTKAPSAVQDFPATSLEKIAYASVASIEAEEPNDANRLAYHVWRWLTTKQGTLEEAIAESGARLHVSKQEARRIISQALQQQGIAAGD